MRLAPERYEPLSLNLNLHDICTKIDGKLAGQRFWTQMEGLRDV